MAYAGQFVRLTFSGVLGTASNPAEIWANNISCRFSGAPPTTRAQLGAISDEIAPLASTFYQGSCSPQMRLTNVRAALIGPDGRTLRDLTGAFLQADTTVNVAGNTGADTLYQHAMVVGLRSAFDGPTGRGRFYVPVPRAAVGRDGLYEQPEVSSMLERCETFIEGINTSGGTNDLFVVVASQGSASKGIAPAFNAVTHVQVGRVPDVQNRRRRDLVEDYEERPIGDGGPI